MLWAPACFFGIALPSMLSVEFLRRGFRTANEYQTACMTANGVRDHVSETSPALGYAFWTLTIICGCTGKWRLGDFAKESIEQIRERVGKSRVICGLSGGVDSSVTAAMLYQAIGPQLSCILVDNGLLLFSCIVRHGEINASFFVHRDHHYFLLLRRVGGYRFRSGYR